MHIERGAEKEVLTQWLLHMLEGKGQKNNHFEWPGFVLTGPEIEMCVQRAVEGKNAEELSQRQSTESAMWFRNNANETMEYNSTSWA